NDPADVDAVSGATLTSLAIIESVAVRLGGTLPSLKFPDPVALADVRRIFPEAASLDAPDAAGRLAVRDGQGTLLGDITRTAPAADDIMGYQGPSDGLLGFAPDGHVHGIALGATYDNQRYAG